MRHLVFLLFGHQAVGCKSVVHFGLEAVEFGTFAEI
jgi:hypothetical protein